MMEIGKAPRGLSRSKNTELTIEIYTHKMVGRVFIRIDKIRKCYHVMELSELNKYRKETVVSCSTMEEAISFLMGYNAGFKMCKEKIDEQNKNIKVLINDLNRKAESIFVEV